MYDKTDPETWNIFFTYMELFIQRNVARDTLQYLVLKMPPFVHTAINGRPQMNYLIWWNNYFIAANRRLTHRDETTHAPFTHVQGMSAMT